MIQSVLSQTIILTSFVLAMMVAIEYINVLLKGSERLRQLTGGWRQYLVAGVLGALPGCLGPWAIVTMYSHGVVTLGALVAAMVATSGDEAFFMLALMPERALAVFLCLLVGGVVFGRVTDLVVARTRFAHLESCAELTFHPEEACELFPRGEIVRQWSSCTRTRALMSIAFLAFALLVAADLVGEFDSEWIRVTLLTAVLFALFAVCTVPDHFLEEHLWGHVLRRHALRIFAWALGALLAAHFIVEVLALDTLSPEGRWTMLLVACLVGIIPQSGPHMVFVTLFADGAIPFSVLLANSIVQDGHGMLPLLAESREAFVVTKAVNVLIGLVVGAAALALGF